MIIELTLYSENEAILDAWSEEFADGLWESDDVKIVEGRLEDLDHQHYVIVPGNSYGLIGGVWEETFKTLLGEPSVEDLKEVVRETIRGHYLATLPVGSAFTIDLSSEGGRLPDTLVYSSYFQFPTNRPLPDADFLCFIGALASIKGRYTEEDTGALVRVAVGDLGVGMSKQPPEKVARQMKLAWDQLLDTPTVTSFQDAMDRTLQRLNHPE